MTSPNYRLLLNAFSLGFRSHCGSREVARERSSYTASAHLHHRTSLNCLGKRGTEYLRHRRSSGSFICGCMFAVAVHSASIEQGERLFVRRRSRNWKGL
jgi:hypothetical protein